MKAAAKSVSKLVLAASLLTLGLSACSTFSKKKQILVARLLPSKMRFRRPEGAIADSKAGPGGQDYISRPEPGPNFDCVPPATILNKIDLKAFRTCFNSAKLVDGLPFVLYKLHRDPQPKWALIPNEKNPACLVKVLSEIPVPREVAYMAPEMGSQEPSAKHLEEDFEEASPQLKYGCYTSRLDLEVDKVMDVKVPRAMTALKLRWPYPEMPKNDDETRRLLLSWSLTPVYQPDLKGFPAKPFPDSLCKQCLGEDLYYKNQGPSPQLWPINALPETLVESLPPGMLETK